MLTVPVVLAKNHRELLVCLELSRASCRIHRVEQRRSRDRQKTLDFSGGEPCIGGVPMPVACATSYASACVRAMPWPCHPEHLMARSIAAATQLLQVLKRWKEPSAP